MLVSRSIDIGLPKFLVVDCTNKNDCILVFFLDFVEVRFELEIMTFCKMLLNLVSLSRFLVTSNTSHFHTTRLHDTPSLSLSI